MISSWLAQATPLPEPPVVSPPVEYVEPAVSWADRWQAWGAIGALALALLLAIIQVLRWWYSQRREQAELVSAWMERHPDWGWSYVVHNGSASAIYTVSTDNDDGTSGAIHWLLIPPGRTMHTTAQGDGSLTPSPVPISFTDAGGRGWSRRKHGALVRNWQHDAIEFYRAGRFARWRHWLRRHTITRG